MPIINLVYEAPEWWKPWANTLAYFPLKENQNDVMWNYTLPLTWTQEQIWYTFNKSWDQNITINSSQRFVSCWVKINSYLSNWAQILSACNGWPFYNYYNSYSDSNKRFQAYSWSSRVFNSDQIQTNANTWYHYAWWWDGTKVVCYLNWSKVAEWTCNVNVWTSCKFITNINVTFSELIYESAVRTDQEISDYYNQTKSNYGY